MNFKSICELLIFILTAKNDQVFVVDTMPINMSIELGVKYDLIIEKLSMHKYSSMTKVINNHRIQSLIYDGNWLTIVTKCWMWNEERQK